MRSDQATRVTLLPPRRPSSVGEMTRPKSLDCIHHEERPAHIRRPASTESLCSMSGIRDVARQAAGGVASCMLAASCAQGFTQDPELGMLIVSGRVDMLSAKVCSLPRAPSTLYDGGDTDDGDAIVEFLMEGDSAPAPLADEASCLASGSSMDDAIPRGIVHFGRTNRRRDGQDDED